MPKLTVGFITYNDQKYLPYFLESLCKQTIINDIEILCVDNFPDNSCREIIEKSSKKFPNGIRFCQSRENIGFTGGHNFMMNIANSRFYACMNNDIVFEPNAFENLLEIFEKNKKVASVQPKLLYWDFICNKQTDIIDSIGINRSFWSSFSEIGQTQKDIGQYDNLNEIFGCTGAFAIYDLEKLKQIAKAHTESISKRFSMIEFGNGNMIMKLQNNYIEYFDDNFFLYKEDVDLAWRLQNEGFSAYVLSNIYAWHDRSIKRTSSNLIKHIFSRKSSHSESKRRLSTRNHIKLLKKNLHLKDGIILFLSGWIHEFIKFIFILFFDFKMIKEYKEIFYK